MYYDSTYLLVIISLIITFFSSIFIRVSYNKYSKIKNKSNLTGKEIARIILDKKGLHDVDIYKTNGYLTDHYNPSKKVINLSSDVYDECSVAAVSIASHECGHALQDKDGYFFLRIRNFFIPLVNFSSYAGYISIILGCFLGSYNLIYIGILAQIVILIFELITLPVEINASKRALREIDEYLEKEERKNAKVMLISAACTYIASVATTLIQILRLLLMFERRRD